MKQFAYRFIRMPMEEFMKCDLCGGVETYTKKYKHVFIIKGKKVEFTALRSFCKECNNLVYDAILDNEASLKAIEVYNNNYGIPKEKIVELRHRFKLSQSLFSKIIGCAKKTLISYEQGRSIPNDNYLILLKSLMKEPFIIKTLVDSNRELFTDKEYQKITSNNKLLEGSFNPDSYNGYTKLNKNKVYNMILYFANKGVLKTKLLKLMFYADFLFYKNSCSSITGLEYAKITYGPVPDNFESIISDCVKNDLISYDIIYKNDYENHNIKSKKKFNKNIFTEEELDTLDKVNNFFKDYTSSEIVEYSHKEKAFKETEYYKNISYDYAFDINIDE